MFCIMSVVGHWIEIGYCTFMDWAFDIVEEDSGVWSNPMAPFPVYGVACVCCQLFLVPLRNRLIEKYDSWFKSIMIFFLISILFCLGMELGMGLLLNQPDPTTGEYPLWDNSVLPGNILGQAWIVNDVALGVLATLFTWVAIPILTWTGNRLNRYNQTVANVASAAIFVAFLFLCQLLN